MAKIPFTIVISDDSGLDASFRRNTLYWWLATHVGAYAELGLYWFLVEYFGRSAVRLIRPSQLLAERQADTDMLFVGCPTTVDQQHLSNISFRQMVLYDSTDNEGIHFLKSNSKFLLSQTDLVLKTWRDAKWKFPFRVGLLPIKRPPINKLRLALLKEKARKQVLGKSREKPFDVGFVARPTGDLKRNQRVEWLVSLRQQRPELKLWGGLVGKSEWRERFRDSPHQSTLNQLWLNRKKIGYFEYFSGLAQSKVALAPRGFAPWTYRHFEALYAGALVVSNDLSRFEFLVPLPRKGIIEVPDGESIVKAVDQALKLYEDSPALVDENIQELEHWMHAGAYSKSKRALLDRFMSQLEAA